ncbi:MFS transporter [Embleya sp. NBC_00888]|uniref:MFS transporter n=1 Tax=Embleya sp. NBC_00888 TaxID=2975960 RepID=UPI003869A65A|nr:MFS transporter [Embleya sp. NBC_00888]
MATLGLSMAGAYMVIPFLAIYLTTERHLSIASAGAVLTTIIVLERGGTFATGILSDRHSPKALMVAGMVTGGAGFLLLASARQMVLIVASAILLGAGNAFFVPACKAVLAIAAEVYGPRVFALRSTAANVGSALGPLIGGVFYDHFTTLLVAASILHLACIFPLGRLRAPSSSGGEPVMGVFKRARSILTDPAAVWLMVASIGFWTCFSQFTLSFPLHAKNVLDSVGAVGVFVALNAIIIISAQIFLVRIFLKRSDQALSVIIHGMILMTVAFGALMAGNGVVQLVTFIIFFSLSELLLGPSLDAAAHAISPRGQEAAYLGFVSVGWAIGAVLGNYLAVLTFDRNPDSDSHFVTWGSCALIAIGTAAAFHLFQTTFRKRSSVLAAEPRGAGGDKSAA